MSMILPWLVLVPVLSIVPLLLVPKAKAQMAAYLGFALSLVPLGMMIRVLAGGFDFTRPQDWQLRFDYNWLPTFGVQFSLGMDGISLWLVMLTAVLTPIAILGSFNYIKERQREFYAWMMVLHAGMLGVFCARDVMLFYLFFEFTLIPMFFIIGIWGGSDRRKAAGKFFLFTFAGSVLTLVSLIYMAYVFKAGYVDAATGRVWFGGRGFYSFAISDLYEVGRSLPAHVQGVLFFGMLAGFAVKVPLFPVHTWLPLAHTEAPTAGSVILAGVLLKLGTYGLLRFAVPMLPDATMRFAPLIAGICIVGILYGALVSWVQGDMKKLIAYSSVSHLGFCVLGMFALTAQGLSGSVMYMINHGLSTGALFLVVGMIYERYHTRDMDQLSGLARRLPALGFFAVFFVFSSVALPGLNGFVSEFLVLAGTFVSGREGHGGNLGPWFGTTAAVGVIFGAVYMLYWAGRVIYGPLKEPAHETEEEQTGRAPVKDLSVREWCVLTPVAVLVVVLGVYPKPLLDSIHAPLHEVQKAAQAHVSPSEAPAMAEAPR